MTLEIHALCAYVCQRLVLLSRGVCRVERRRCRGAADCPYTVMLHACWAGSRWVWMHWAQVQSEVFSCRCCLVSAANLLREHA